MKNWFPVLFALIQPYQSSGRLIGGRSSSPNDVVAHAQDEKHENNNVSRRDSRRTFATASTGTELKIRRDPRIIGGSLSTKGEYPYAVSLKSRSTGHFCGGSLIAKDVVLSAAHCATSNFYVVVGRHSLNSNEGEAISVKAQVPHPRYRSSGTDNDFNLIFLNQAADAEVVRLNPSSAAPNEGDSVVVMGWGDTVASNSVSQLSNTLREVEVKVVSNRNCAQSTGYVGGFYNSYNGAITNNMLCAKDQGEDSCQGDSGGPLVLKKEGGHEQVGVVSWGLGCANPNFPGVYARVSAAYDWIKTEVCERSSYPPDEFDCPSPTATPDESDNDNEDTDTGSNDNNDGPCEAFSFDLRTDNHASETSWIFEEIPEVGSASMVGSGPPQGTRYGDSRYYKDAAYGCLPPGTYRFTINDSYGDGIFAPGFYRLTLNGEVVKLSRGFGPSESTEFVVGSATNYVDNDNADTSEEKTEILLEEDFNFGYGRFNRGGNDVLHYSNILGRDGVVRLENGNGMGSSIYSDELRLAGNSYSKINVIFSFYGNSMEPFEEFCIDYMINDVENWLEVKCFARGRDFANDQWYDDVMSSIDLDTDGIDSMRVRFRCDANSIQDDILIDQVKIVGSK